MDLPQPDCEFGYPFAQLRERVSDNAFELFQESVLHRTVTICEGEACSDPHGRIAFVRDVRRFARSIPASSMGGRAE
ncbi:hypothetical protein F8O07_08550 [Pseudoclavibacter sp. CFCC 13796]|uniref:hypothetical protein n=1 Tax=Pseudoclavibacter sp. CFCC 13796 TaxID=2615179 RepID=UPI00130138E5|nr:hypothetical protein [Pseudoclavibacter sp. CFCC 13796]KAB1661915.1 hypothetical protein F8O07_08550 [Pseudoclavibacter sp. CFCC 13796]